jgi:hypothetical protein
MDLLLNTSSCLHFLQSVHIPHFVLGNEFAYLGWEGLIELVPGHLP